jgi:preprotein translocase subunit YajC
MNSFGFLILIVAFAFLWLVLVRPQKKRQVAQQRMLSELRVGDEVLSAGGIYGTIVRLDEEAATVEIAPGVEIRLARRAVAGVTPRDGESAAEPADVNAPDEENPG